MTTSAEGNFLKQHDLCRLAMASSKGSPHVTPVIYAYDGVYIIIAIDYETKKLKHLRENPHISLVVDDVKPNKAVVI